MKKGPLRGPLRLNGGQLTAAIHATVVVEVVLPIVLLSGNAAALHVLCLAYPGAFARSHHAVGLGAGFHVLHALLAGFEAARFARRQLAGGNALLNADFLIGLALVDDRRGLGEGGNGNGGDEH